MKDTKTKERFVELRASGMSYDRIAKEIGVSKQTLINWSGALSVEIANLKAVEWEALLEKHMASREQRLKRFTKVLNQVSAELDKRDLASIPSEKLLEVFLKFNAAVKDECTSGVVFQSTGDG